jgi:uncharacterized protein YPO0396
MVASINQAGWLAMNDHSREMLTAEAELVAVEDPDAGDRTIGPGDPRMAGFRLDELQIQNFGTYDGPPSVIRFGGGGAIFTGRNGVGKTTAIDAFRMLIAQEPSFNDATTPESRKRDRDIRTYYQGVLGKLQRDGQKEYRVLRPYEERKFMAILGIFCDAHGRAISAARLVQYDPQGQGNSQRYVIARDRLDIARDFPRFETGRAIRAALADKRVRVYETFNAYRAALSGLFGIEDPKQAWALFERAIGTKTVDNLTDFMRDLILPASMLAETADQLVLSTVALDDAYQTVKLDEAKLLRLQRIVREIDELEESFQVTARLRGLQALRRLAAAAVVARAVRNDLKKREAAFVATTREYEAASTLRDDLGRRVSDLELQERAVAGQRVSDWRRDIEARSSAIAAINSDLAKLSTSLSAFGTFDAVSFEESHHTEAQWLRIKATLRERAGATPRRIADMDKTLAQLSSEIATLESEVVNRGIDLRAAERSKSNLPRQLIEVREQIAEMLGVSTDTLPFFGELVRVSGVAVRDGWEGALNRLLGNQARRLLVPDRFYAEAAAMIDGRHLGVRLEYDRVDALPWRETEHGHDRVAGKLEVRKDSEFAGHIRQVLDNRYDHACFATVDDGFRRARRALTKAGQSKDGDRHVKDDRKHIDDRASFMLGWDTAERTAILAHDLRRLEQAVQAATQTKAQLRARRDSLMIQADQMLRLADSLDEFQSVDIARIEREIHERETWIVEATSQSPDYLVITAALSKARTAFSEARDTAQLIGNRRAVEDHKIKEQVKRLTAFDAERAQRDVPLSAWRGYRHVVRQIDRRADIFAIDPEATNTLNDGVWEAVRTRLDEALNKEGKRRETTIANLIRLAQDYLREFTAEGSHLATIGLTDEDASATRKDWRQRRITIESRDLIRHRERLQQAMTDAIDNGIVNVKTQLEKERLEIRDTIAGINETLRAVTYDPAHGTRIRFVAHDSMSQRIAMFVRDLRQVTDDWIGNRDGPIEDRYLKTKRFIDQVKDVPENAAWRREVLDSRRWFTFVAQEYKAHSDGSEDIVNDYDGASGSSGGQKERLAMTVMAAGLAWRFGMVNEIAAAKSFRVLMLDEAFKNSHDDTTRALLELFKAFGFQMIFAVPSKNLAVVANHIERAFAVDTKNRRTILTVHALKDLVHSNQSSAAAVALRMAKDAGVDVADLDLSEIDERLAGLTAADLIRLATNLESAE